LITAVKNKIAKSNLYKIVESNNLRRLDCEVTTPERIVGVNLIPSLKLSHTA